MPVQHKGVIQVFNLMFQQFNVTQILIKDFNMGQNEGFKNVQPYSFTCVAVEPDDAVNVVQDTINGTNLEISQMKKQGWAKVLLDKVKAYVFFKGRSILFKEQGEVLLLRFANDLEEYAKVEQMPGITEKKWHVISWKQPVRRLL